MTNSILTAQLLTLHCLNILNRIFSESKPLLAVKTSGYNSCVSEDSSILEMLDPEYEGTMILKKCSNFSSNYIPVHHRTTESCS